MNHIEDLVIAYRILAHYGVIDGYGHISIRAPSNPQHYLIARAKAPELVTADDIITCDLESNAIPETKLLLYRERYIHGEIYKKRPEIQAVVHSHSPSVIPFSVTEEPLKALYHMAAFVGLGIPNFEIRKVQQGTNMLVETPELGRALAQLIGDKPGALMRGHGSVVVGENLGGAVARSIYLELSAKLQAQAMTIAGPGGAITYLDDDEVREAVNMQSYGRAWELWRRQGLALLKASKESL